MQKLSLLPERANSGRSPALLAGIYVNSGLCSRFVAGPLRFTSDPGSAVVLDAGALGRLKDLRGILARHNGQMVITPHAGAMANLIGLSRSEVLSNPSEIAGETARLLNCVVALKGARTYIASPDGEQWSYSDGNVGLATLGSGNTLAGIIAGLLARGVAPSQAAQWGVFLHGEAGTRLAHVRGRLGFVARELLAEIPSIMAEFDQPPSELGT